MPFHDSFDLQSVFNRLNPQFKVDIHFSAAGWTTCCLGIASFFPNRLCTNSQTATPRLPARAKACTHRQAPLFFTRHLIF